VYKRQVLVSFPGDFLETPSGFSEYANPLTISEDDLGFKKAPQLEKSEWFGRFHSSLVSSGHDFVLSDTSLDPQRWVGYKVVVLTTLDYLDADVQRALVAYAAGGGTVVIGPRAPQFDSLMQPCTVLADAIAGGAARIHLAGSTGDASAIVMRACAQAGVPTIGRNDQRLDVIVHSDRENATRKVVFLVNPTPEPIEARVSLGVAVSSATELWSGESVAPAGDVIACSMKPYSIHVYECHTA
jgi:beta-galactosidase